MMDARTPCEKARALIEETLCDGDLDYPARQAALEFFRAELKHMLAIVLLLETGPKPSNVVQMRRAK